VEPSAVRHCPAAHLEPVAHQRAGSDPPVSTVLQQTQTARALFRVPGTVLAEPPFFVIAASRRNLPVFDSRTDQV